MSIANLDHGRRAKLRVCREPPDQGFVLDRRGDVKKMDFNDVERIGEQNNWEPYDSEGIWEKLQPPENNQRIGQVAQHEVFRGPSPFPRTLSHKHEGMSEEFFDLTSSRIGLSMGTSIPYLSARSPTCRMENGASRILL